MYKWVKIFCLVLKILVPIGAISLFIAGKVDPDGKLEWTSNESKLGEKISDGILTGIGIKKD